MSESELSPANLDRGRAGGAQPFRWGLFVRHMVTVLTVLLVIGAGVGIYLGIKPMERRAADLIAGRKATVRFEWPLMPPPPPPPQPSPTAPAAAESSPPPAPKTWLPLVLQEHLTQTSQDIINRTADPFSPEPLAALAKALAASGWFEGHPSVRRDDKPGMYGVVVEGVWRVPAALVRWNGTDRIVSWKAQPMPPSGPAADTSDLVIVGVASGPPTTTDGQIDYAKIWAGDELGAAIELLALITQQRWKDQINAIEVQEYTRHKKLTLVTRFGTRVVWGGRPSKPLIGEASTQLKLANIATLVRDTRRVDGGYPLIYMDQPTPTFDVSATASLLRKDGSNDGGGGGPPLAAGAN